FRLRRRLHDVGPRLHHPHRAEFAARVVLIPHPQTARRPADAVRSRTGRLPAVRAPWPRPTVAAGQGLFPNMAVPILTPRRNRMNRFARKLAIPLCFVMFVGVACGKDKKNDAAKGSDTKNTKADIKVGAIFDLS